MSTQLRDATPSSPITHFRESSAAHQPPLRCTRNSVRAALRMESDNTTALPLSSHSAPHITPERSALSSAIELVHHHIVAGVNVCILDASERKGDVPQELVASRGPHGARLLPVSPPFPGKTGMAVTPRYDFLPERSDARSLPSASRSPTSRRATQTGPASASPMPPEWTDRS